MRGVVYKSHDWEFRVYDILKLKNGMYVGCRGCMLDKNKIPQLIVTTTLISSKDSTIYPENVEKIVASFADFELFSHFCMSSGLMKDNPLCIHLNQAGEDISEDFYK